jgi:hypothetical protein
MKPVEDYFQRLTSPSAYLERVETSKETIIPNNRSVVPVDNHIFPNTVTTALTGITPPPPLGASYDFRPYQCQICTMKPRFIAFVGSPDKVRWKRGTI